MSAIRSFVFCALAGAALGAHGAPAEHNVNAAEIGNGVPRGIDWSQEDLQTPVFCGTACSYIEVSAAKIAPDSLFTYNPTAWPGNYVTNAPNVASVFRNGDPTPAGTYDSSGREIVYETSTYERASVDVGRAAQSINTKVYQSGNQGSGLPGTAVATAAYHVKVQNQSTSGRDYFIRFIAPKPTGGMGVPYYYGGPSQNQSFNQTQKKYAKRRSAVDILVNGLPVWSTSTSTVIPDETSQSANYKSYKLDFGYDSMDDSYTVFVGRYASGADFEMDFIVRTEAYSRAPECSTVNEPMTYPNPRALKHCLLVTDGRELPLTNNQQERFEIYSKVVSTPVYEVLPGPGPLTGTLNSTALNSLGVQ